MGRQGGRVLQIIEPLAACGHWPEAVPETWEQPGASVPVMEGGSTWSRPCSRAHWSSEFSLLEGCRRFSFHVDRWLWLVISSRTSSSAVSLTIRSRMGPHGSQKSGQCDGPQTAMDTKLFSPVGVQIRRLGPLGSPSVSMRAQRGESAHRCDRPHASVCQTKM